MVTSPSTPPRCCVRSSPRWPRTWVASISSSLAVLPSAQGLAQLGEEQQTVLLYRFGERYSAQRAAELMGKTEGAIKALQHRALGNLRRILGAAAHQ